MTRTPMPLALLGFLASCGGAAGPVDGARALAHAAQLCRMSPRPPGSQNLADCADYIQQELRKLGLSPRVQEFTRPEKAPEIVFRNIWVEIPGTDPKGRIVAIGAHYDSKLADGHPDGKHNFPFIGAVDAAGACGVLLDLARALTSAPEPRLAPNVWLIWFDGEESLDWEWGSGDRALLGSKHFVETMNADTELFPRGLSSRMRVFVLLDLIGDHEQKIDEDRASNKRLLEVFKATAQTMGEGHRMFRYYSEMQDDHIPFKNYSVNVIDLIDFLYRDESSHTENMPEEAKKYTPWWHTENDTMDQLSADSLGFVGNLVWNALPEIEREFYK